MAYQHYIPASYLANFAAVENEENRRKNLVIIGDKSNPEEPIREAVVGRICGENGFYVIQECWNFSIDSIWNYEGDLRNALLKLVNNQVDSDTWLKTLLPFVVCQFLRSKDFETRFKNRINSIGMNEHANLENKAIIDQARIIEIQRLLCPILTAKWIVLTTQGNDNLIVNDVGFIPFKNFLVHHQGFALPIDKRHILVLATQRKGVLFKLHDKLWIPDIKYYTLPVDNHLNFNKNLGRYSNRYIIGDSAELIEKNLSRNVPRLVDIEPLKYFNFSGADLAAYEFSWHRLVSFVDAYNKNPENTDFPINQASIRKYWDIPVFYPVNLMNFPSIFSRKDNEVIFDCYDTNQYFLYCSYHNLCEMQQFEAVKYYRLLDLLKVKDKELQRQIFLQRQIALSEINKPLQSLFESIFNRIRDKDYYFLRAVSLMDLNQNRRALLNLHKSCKFDDDNEKSLLNIAVCLLRLNQIDCAISVLLALISSKDNYISNIARLNLGLIYIKRKDFDLGIKELKLVRVDTISITEKKTYYSHLINACFKEKKLSRIPALILKLEEIIPDSIIVYDFQRQYADEMDKPAQFLQSTEKLLKKRIPNSIASYLHLQRSNIYSAIGKRNKSMVEIKQAIRKSFFNFQNHAQKSEILLLDKKYINAIYESVLGLFFSKNDGRLYNSLGLIFFTMGKVKIATILFHISIKLLENNEEIIRPYRNLMRCYLDLNKIKEAETLITLITKLAPDSNETKVLMSQYQISKNDFKKALQLLPQVKDGQSGYEEILLLKLIILNKSNKQDECIKINKILANKGVLEFTLRKYDFTAKTTG